MSGPPRLVSQPLRFRSDACGPRHRFRAREVCQWPVQTPHWRLVCGEISGRATVTASDVAVSGEVLDATAAIGGKPTRSAERACGRAPEAARQPGVFGGIGTARCLWLSRRQCLEAVPGRPGPVVRVTFGCHRLRIWPKARGLSGRHNWPSAGNSRWPLTETFLRHSLGVDHGSLAMMKLPRPVSSRRAQSSLLGVSQQVVGISTRAGWPGHVRLSTT